MPAMAAAQSAASAVAGTPPNRGLQVRPPPQVARSLDAHRAGPRTEVWRWARGVWTEPRGDRAQGCAGRFQDPRGVTDWDHWGVEDRWDYPDDGADYHKREGADGLVWVALSHKRAPVAAGSPHKGGHSRAPSAERSAARFSFPGLDLR